LEKALNRRNVKGSPRLKENQEGKKKKIRNRKKSKEKGSSKKYY